MQIAILKYVNKFTFRTSDFFVIYVKRLSIFVFLNFIYKGLGPTWGHIGSYQNAFESSLLQAFVVKDNQKTNKRE